jgi:hypothetical protein
MTAPDEVVERERLAQVEAERDGLARWKAEALEVIGGLQELGKALDLRLGERITGPAALVAVKKLKADLAAAEQRGAEKALREAADECHKEARWQAERARRGPGTRSMHQYAQGRVSLVEQSLIDRADRLAAQPGEATDA